MRVTLSADAVIDLREIIIFGTDRWGHMQARAYVAELRRALMSLADYPRLGSPAEGLGDGLYRLTTARHIAYYRTGQHGIVVMRVLHASRAPERHVR